MVKNKALFFSHVDSGFIRKDFEIVSNHIETHRMIFNQANILQAGSHFIKQFLLIMYYLPSTAFYFSGFSSYHSFLPSLFSKLFKIPHFIVLHGADINSVKSIGYGHRTKFPLRFFNDLSIQLATEVLPVSYTLVNGNYNYTPELFTVQGLDNIPKFRKTKYKIISNGIRTELFINKNVPRKKNSFLTVCTGLSSSKRMQIKGVDIFIEAAIKNPLLQFTIVGAEHNLKLSGIPANLQIIPKVNHQELVEIYNTHVYYVQLSIIESFGLAVCEAILCGCIPIISNIPALIEIAGDSGFLLKVRNIKELNQIIQNLINSPEENVLVKQRANYLRKKYDLNERKKSLLLLLDSYDLLPK